MQYTIDLSHLIYFNGEHNKTLQIFSSKKYRIEFNPYFEFITVTFLAILIFVCPLQ